MVVEGFCVRQSATNRRYEFRGRACPRFAELNQSLEKVERIGGCGRDGGASPGGGPPAHRRPPARPPAARPERSPPRRATSTGKRCRGAGGAAEEACDVGHGAKCGAVAPGEPARARAALRGGSPNPVTPALALQVRAAGPDAFTKGVAEKVWMQGDESIISQLFLAPAFEAFNRPATPGSYISHCILWAWDYLQARKGIGCG